MSVYRCDKCENTYDADFHGIEQHPNDEALCVCEDCYDQLTNIEDKNE